MSLARTRSLAVERIVAAAALAALFAVASPAAAQFTPVGPGTPGPEPQAGVYRIDRDAGIGTSNPLRRNNYGSGGFTRLGKQPNDLEALFHFDNAPVRAAIADAVAPFNVTPQQARDAGALRVSFVPFLMEPASGPFIAVESFLTGTDWVAEGNGTSPSTRNYTGQAVTFANAIDVRDDLDPGLTPTPWTNPDGTPVADLNALANRFRNTAGFTTTTQPDEFVPVQLDANVWYPLLYGPDGSGAFGGHLRTYGDAPEPNDNVAAFKQREANASQRAYLFVEFNPALVPEPAGVLLFGFGAAAGALASRRRGRSRGDRPGVVVPGPR
jgi:hypothetical protein